MSFTQASGKAQKPALLQALRHVRDGLATAPEDKSHELRRFLRTVFTTIRIERNNGAPWGPFPKPKAFHEKLERWKGDLEHDLASLKGDQLAKLEALLQLLQRLGDARKVKYAQFEYAKAEIEDLLTAVSGAHSAFGGHDADTLPVDVDAPHEFSGEALLRSLEATAEMLNVGEYTETLLIRIRALLADARMKTVIGDGSKVSLAEWLSDYVGSDTNEAGPLTIIDLSLVPSEIVHIVTAVAARMIFEALQRYRKLNDVALPTVLVMEEAHSFIRRYKDDVENHDAATICCQVFERIAREGRKFGLGLVLSSQRPSELSQTVLSQCNTFLLHRISNDRDQELVNRLVPDNLRGLLRELPSLPSQNAILLGWASELPLLVRMDDLPKEQRPHSDDPDFWNVWVGKDDDGQPLERKVDWERVADDWQGRAVEPKLTAPTEPVGNPE